MDYTGAAAFKEKIATLTSAAPSIEKEEEEKQHQAELQRAQDQLKKCLEDQDYTGAAAVQEKIAALMSAAPSVEKEEEKRQTQLRRAQDQLKKCIEDGDYLGAAAFKDKVAVLMSAAPSVEKEEEDEEEEEEEKKKKRQAKLLCAQDKLKKCLEDGNYTGAAAVKEKIAALMSAEPCSQRMQGRSKADWSAVTAAGHGSLSATGPVVASAPLAKGRGCEGCTRFYREARWRASTGVPARLTGRCDSAVLRQGLRSSVQ